MNCDLFTTMKKKMSPLMWANMVLDLEKVGIDGKLLLNSSDTELIKMHNVYFPIPFDVD